MPGEVKQVHVYDATEMVLKPCPFCGGEPKYFSRNTDGFVACERVDCYAATGVQCGAEAIAAWNRRALSEEAVRGAAEEIVREYLSEPCREVDDDGNVCAWTSDVEPESIVFIIRRHLEGERMGCYDSVMVPCPVCGELSEFQSKGGDCTLSSYTLANIPDDVLGDINRHSPNICDKCGTIYKVKLRIFGEPAIWCP